MRDDIAGKRWPLLLVTFLLSPHHSPEIPGISAFIRQFYNRGPLPVSRGNLMIVFREARKRPLPWRERRQQIPSWTTPFFALEWVWEWVAFALSRWTFVEVLEYLGSLSVLVAVFFYFYESGDRVQQRHYQAWQVINTAQGKGGSGGRIEAMQELNHDGVPLVGVDVSGAFLQAIRLDNARLRRSDFSAADVRNGNFASADLIAHPSKPRSRK